MGSKWMVDAEGIGGDASESSVKRVLQDNDFEDFIRSQGGLASAVQVALDDLGYRASDRGGGGGSWHVGVPFDNLEEAVTYLETMTTRFGKAIAASLLRFELKTWSTECWNA